MVKVDKSPRLDFTSRKKTEIYTLIHIVIHSVDNISVGNVEKQIKVKNL